MSLYQLQKFMFHVHSDRRAKRDYLANPSAYIEDYVLSPIERAAILAVDIRGLYQMGVHPLLLRPFTDLHGINSKTHYAALEGLE
jgi:hypothetical protein